VTNWPTKEEVDTMRTRLRILEGKIDKLCEILKELTPLNEDDLMERLELASLD